MTEYTSQRVEFVEKRVLGGERGKERHRDREGETLVGRESSGVGRAYLLKGSLHLCTN